MIPIKLARPNEIPLLAAAGYRSRGQSRHCPSFVVMCLDGVEPPVGAVQPDDEETYVLNAVAALDGDPR
ncbi:MAG TPA: hypothetical protein VNZ94_00420 [Xanthobacteraceae bacterium]|nr:hypothetical protein [Xanthobacteraceae bacterium]